MKKGEISHFKEVKNLKIPLTFLSVFVLYWVLNDKFTIFSPPYAHFNLLFLVVHVLFAFLSLIKDVSVYFFKDKQLYVAICVLFDKMGCRGENVASCFFPMIGSQNICVYFGRS